MNRQIYSLLLSLWILTACTVGPDFEKPAAPSAQAYTQDKSLDYFGSQHIDPSKTLTEAWWEDLGSEKLNAVMAHGIEHSHTLKAAKESLKQSLELVKAQKGVLWPQLSLDAAGGRQKYGVALFGPATILIPPFTYYELGPSLTYLLDVFGSTRRTIEKQEALLDYQAQQYNAAYLSLTGSIASTALKIAILQEQLDVAEKILEKDRAHVRLVEKALDLGSATKPQVLAAQTQLSTDEALIPGLKQLLSQAVNELTTLVSETPTEWAPPRLTLSDFTLPQVLPMTLPSELVRTRPDILAAEATLHAASADVGIATANLYPSIMITGTLMQESLTPGALFAPGATAWSYLGGLSTPLFYGGTLRAQRRAAEHAYESSFENYKQIVVQALTQVNDVLHALKEDESTAAARDHVVTTTKASMRLAHLSFDAGSVGMVSVLEADKRHLQALIDDIKARGQRYQDAVQLYLVLGGRSSLE